MPPLDYEWRTSLAHAWTPAPGSDEPSPIVRLWRGRTPRHLADQYRHYLLETGVRECRATPGNRAVRIFERVEGECAEFLFASWWNSLEAIRRFAGPTYERARYFPEDEKFLMELEPRVLHYKEVLVQP